jgi:hypothetical protein
MEQLYQHCITVLESNTREHFTKKRNEFRSNKENELIGKRKLANELAFDLIEKDAENKIREAVELGYTNVNLYLFRKSDNIKCNDVFLSDCLRKGNTLQMLKDKFAPFNIYLKRLNTTVGNIVDVVVADWRPITQDEDNTKDKPLFTKVLQNQKRKK